MDDIEVTIRCLEYHDNSSNSHKYYNITTYGRQNGEVHWGRIGTKGTKKKISYNESFRKLDEKLCKGYVLKDSRVYELNPGSEEGIVFDAEKPFVDFNFMEELQKL